jgi:hypothetical protein
MPKTKPAKPAAPKDQMGAPSVPTQSQQSSGEQTPQQGGSSTPVRYTDWASI